MRRIASTATLVSALLLGFATPAAADQPVTASGPFTTLSDNLTLIRIADGNTFFAETLTLAYAGDLTGPAVDTDTLLVLKNGTFSSHGTEVCTACTLAGITGDFSAVFTLTGFTPDGFVHFQYSGHLTFVGGAGGLAGLRGQGTFQGTELGNTYSYNYSFAT